MPHSHLHISTPLIESLAGNHTYKTFLKLENTQPSGSFKLRGIGYHCLKLYEQGCLHFISSSGGNAGLAVAYCGRKLSVPVTVFVPTSTAKHVIKKLEKENATVFVKGTVWDETNRYAEEFVTKHNKSALVHPFNHPEIWSGHSSMIQELKSQLVNPPSAVVVSVGGGGLLCGVLEGLHASGWSHVPVVALETEGADCFNKALDANRVVTLPKISSIAKSLGALAVLPEALEWRKKHNILSRVVTDKSAVSACLQFAEDHKMLVEPACGASLASMYGNVMEKLFEEGNFVNLESIVIIVCGGSSIELNTLIEWKELFQL